MYFSHLRKRNSYLIIRKYKSFMIWHIALFFYVSRTLKSGLSLGTQSLAVRVSTIGSLTSVLSTFSAWSPNKQDWYNAAWSPNKSNPLLQDCSLLSLSFYSTIVATIVSYCNPLPSWNLTFLLISLNFFAGAVTSSGIFDLAFEVALNLVVAGRQQSPLTH